MKIENDDKKSADLLIFFSFFGKKNCRKNPFFFVETHQDVNGISKFNQVFCGEAFKWRFLKKYFCIECQAHMKNVGWQNPSIQN